MRWQEGCNHITNSQTCWVDNLQTGKELYHRNSPMGVKILNPRSGSPTWWSGNGRRRRKRIWLWKPGGFDCRTSTGLGETETLLLDGTQKVSCTPGSRGKKQWPHKSLGQVYLLVLEGLLQRWGVAAAHCGYKDTSGGSSEKYFTGLSPPESHHFLIQTSSPKSL